MFSLLLYTDREMKSLVSESSLDGVGQSKL
jgi:hypothetical protein